MHIMAAGVHYAFFRGATGMTCFFFHGKSVHISPERHAWSISGSPEDARHSVSAEAFDDLHARFPENSGHERGSSAFLVAELRLPVYPAAQIQYSFDIAGHYRFKHLIHDDSSGRRFSATVRPIKKVIETERG
jgi:hypothetical protein